MELSSVHGASSLGNKHWDFVIMQELSQDLGDVDCIPDNISQ